MGSSLSTVSPDEVVVETPGGCRSLPDGYQELTWLRFSTPAYKSQIDLLVKKCPKLRKLSLSLPVTKLSRKELESEIAELNLQEAALSEIELGPEPDLKSLKSKVSIGSRKMALEHSLDKYTLIPYFKERYPNLELFLYESGGRDKRI